jgi:hypothetical protein
LYNRIHFVNEKKKLKNTRQLFTISVVLLYKLNIKTKSGQENKPDCIELHIGRHMKPYVRLTSRHSFRSLLSQVVLKTNVCRYIMAEDMLLAVVSVVLFAEKWRLRIIRHNQEMAWLPFRTTNQQMPRIICRLTVFVRTEVPCLHQRFISKMLYHSVRNLIGPSEYTQVNVCTANASSYAITKQLPATASVVQRSEFLAMERRCTVFPVTYELNLYTLC